MIFQEDIFKYFSDKGDYFAYATEADDFKGTNTGAQTNYNWMVNQVGKYEAYKLLYKPIICCGTLLGSFNEMKTFLQYAWQYLKYTRHNSIDQAVINYIIYNNIVPVKNLQELDCWKSEVFTPGLFIRYNPVNIANEKILRGDGGIPAVVHQYDRHPDLTKLVDKLYREKDFQPDENFTDFQSAFDQVFCLVQRQNFSAATKFFINYVVYAENLNSYGEKLLKLVRLLLQNYNPDAEILFLAIQKTFSNIFSANINIQQMEQLYQVFVVAEKNLHCVNPSFKNFIKNMLVAFTDIFYRNNQQNSAKEYIKRLTDWRD